MNWTDSYPGGINERPEIRLRIENNIDHINVVVTTYTLAKAKDDNKFLSRLRPCVRENSLLIMYVV